MPAIPTTPSLWDWAVWTDVYIEGADLWNRSRYMGKKNFDETCEQYWEIQHPHPSNSIGLARKDKDRIDRWMLTGDGLAVDPQKWCIPHGRLWTSNTVGLHWNPEERSVSLFVDDVYRGVMWRDIPESFLPTISLWPANGRLGRRTQDMGALHALCRKSVTDLVHTPEGIDRLPLPKPVRKDLEENVVVVWKSRRHLSSPT